MSIPTQGQFDSLLGYSLKRDYLGDSFNWRNIETFTLTVTITDMGNISKDAHGDNYLSSFIKDTLKSKYGADRNNITIKSIDIENNHADADHIRLGKYKVTAEVRSKIDETTLLAQHPELDDTGGNTAESHKFHGVKSLFTTYAEEIDSISESFTFDDKEEGTKDFSHTVDLTIRSQTSSNSSKTIAQNIANSLFAQDANNTYFGHNAFSGALQNYGGGTNKHFFTESYDQFTNKFSFTKKMTILPESQATYTTSKKYSLDIKPDGGISVAETLELKSRNGTYSDVQSAIETLKASSHTRCQNILANYSNTIDGQGSNTASTPTMSATLQTHPVSQTIAYDKQGLTAVVSTSFSNDVQVSSKGSLLETIDLNREHKGIVTATYNLTINSFFQKQLNGDTLVWEEGSCSDNSYSNRADCVANAENWTFPKTVLDKLKDYSNDAHTKICTIANYSDTVSSDTTRNFSNIMSWWWPTGSDKPDPNAFFTIDKVAFLRQQACSFFPTNTSVSSANMGKTFSLTKVFTNDVIYDLDTATSAAIQTDYRNLCANCFKKIEVKWQDTWPKRVVNEHPIINRESNSLTKNRPKTSVLADVYMTQPGKRSVTINAQLKRKLTNNLTNPYFPTNELKALAAEAKSTLVQVFTSEKVKNSYQYVAYISNINYTFNSENAITMTAELTYTYKAPPPTYSPNQL